MASGFERFGEFSTATLVFKAILGASAANLFLFGFILLRRLYRKRYFAYRDARVFYFRKNWEALLNGELPISSWRSKAFDRRVVESLVLDDLESTRAPQAGRLLEFLRTSGLLQKRVFDARHHRGWRRKRALILLGLTRAPEGVAALSEGMRDADAETRLAAVRGLGRTGLPEAATEILDWLDEKGLDVPAVPLMNALMNCCRECPGCILPHFAFAQGRLREVFARVLAEVATAEQETDLLLMAGDDMGEVRASAARGLARIRTAIALPALAELVGDPAWFVRLRAVVGLGDLGIEAAIPALLRGVKDPHRLVRLRSAQALVQQDDRAGVLNEVVASGDAYALDALISAMAQTGMREVFLKALQLAPEMTSEQRERLWKAATQSLWPVREASPSSETRELVPQ
jgi:HEAT repeat protein